MMDSQAPLEGRLIDIVDEAWRRDTLPEEEIAVPLYELPDPEPDNSGAVESLRQQEHSWTDLSLQRLAEQRQPTD
ncbi:anaphase-promoting complex subunit 13-like [Pollicipes pollicipes]|uniref:anaphase-promoting complex subunit 13-like n=1 Tax=Pollicipes pollicipes TaxID=41117 RepID=UPI00188543E3|nr:anaphase-promoting complex subunit 13-like [Pollicipes pollicipes]XP_037092958.1 anaphase-promoting complex subunit 13-like [Pollicipes pollicipes]XP_037092959.1 anaphase-promoting complex subunit 13-like [Pollicipes pollicipes]